MKTQPSQALSQGQLLLILGTIKHRWPDAEIVFNPHNEQLAKERAARKGEPHENIH